MKRSSMRFLLLHHRYPHTGWQAFLLRWLLIATHLAVLWISAEDDDSNRPGTFPYLRDDHHASGASAPSFSFPKAHTILNASQIQDFRRDGFLFVRGLWDQNHKSNTDSFQPPPPPLLDPIIRASEQLVRDAVTANTTTPQTYFGIHQKGVMIRHTEFRNLAVYSSIPQVVAELMGLDAKTQNVRILRYVHYIQKKSSILIFYAQSSFVQSFQVIFFLPKAFTMIRRVIGTWTIKDFGPKAFNRKRPSYTESIKVASMFG